MAGNILQWCLDWFRPIILNIFANARSPSILPQREKHDVVSHRNKRIARRTSATGMREEWNVVRFQRAPKDGRQRLNDLLALLVFGERPETKFALRLSTKYFRFAAMDASRLRTL
jgi:hypothetical protein